MLVGARFVQGVGGALASAVILGHDRDAVPRARPSRRRRSASSASSPSAGASIGLLAGGVLTEAINWHWIFFVNLPIGAATALFAAAPARARRRASASRRGADVPGAVLIVGALMLGVYTIVEAGERGWGSAATLGLGAVALALLAAFVAREATARQPLDPAADLPLAHGHGRQPDPGPDRRRAVRHVLPRRAVPAARCSATTRSRSGSRSCPSRSASASCRSASPPRLIMRFGARATLVPGLVLIAAGLLLFTRVPVDGDYVDRHPAGDAAARRRRRRCRSPRS